MKQKEKLAIYNNSLYPYGIEEDTNLGVKQLGVIHYVFYPLETNYLPFQADNFCGRK